MGQRWTALSASCASPCPAPRGRRQRGQRVIGETVASAISMDESRMWDPDFKASVGWAWALRHLLIGRWSKWGGHYNARS